jgi:hypothetical protein
MTARAGELTVTLSGHTEGVTLVGAVGRWDEDGKPKPAIDPKAKIEAPHVDARAASPDGSHWVFSNLPAGTYDLIVVAPDRKVRIEGFRYPPVLEFDPFLPPDAEAPEEDTGTWIVKDIAKSQHYENKVKPLYLAAADKKQVRILMQLVRDKPTSYDAEFGAPVATVRHEVWQYTFQYGGWVKDRKTAVLDRILMAKADFHKWTWIWDPKLGNIQVGSRPVKVESQIPSQFDPETAKGWFPE